jgi:hypothetical protein
MKNDPTRGFTISSSLPLGPSVDGEPARPKPLPGIHLSARFMVPPFGAPLEYQRGNLSRLISDQILKNPAFFTTERTNEYALARITVDCLVLTETEMRTALEEAYTAGYRAGQYSSGYPGVPK